MRNDNRGSLAAILFLLLFLAIGVFATIHGARDLSEALAAKSWPTATGAIIDARVEYRRGGGKNNDGAHYPVVRYRYLVNGREPGPSPCPGLIAEEEQAGAGAKAEALKALFECKMRRPHYQRLREDRRLAYRVYRDRLQPDLYPEERAIRALLSVLAGRRRPPPDAKIHPAPRFASDPEIDGVLDDPVWSVALRLPLPGAPSGSQSRLLLGWRGDFLYAAVTLAAACACSRHGSGCGMPPSSPAIPSPWAAWWSWSATTSATGSSPETGCS